MDLAHSWEDISGRSGPLVSPKIFDECVAPAYRKIRNKLEEYGVSFYSIDSDGDITDLVGHWLDAGVNIMFPIQTCPHNVSSRVSYVHLWRATRHVGEFSSGNSTVSIFAQHLLE